MRAMVLANPGEPLHMRELPRPAPGAGEVLLRVRACGVCRTDLHAVDGELPDPKLPLVPGHEIVGEVVERGQGAARFAIGQRVGVPWLAWTCGQCDCCRGGRENLCTKALFTGYTRDGGYAEFAVADERFCLALPEAYSDEAVAPLLCAGLIGYRALEAAGGAQTLGIYGFGAAGHIIAQVAKAQSRTVYAFTRPGDEQAQAFAYELGVAWAGDSGRAPPSALDGSLIFAPDGALVPEALRNTRPGGTVVCAGIHMSDIPSFPYRVLWGERVVRSVANLTRSDGEGFFRVAAQASIHTATQAFALSRANDALSALRTGTLRGAAVLVPD